MLAGAFGATAATAAVAGRSAEMLTPARQQEILRAALSAYDDATAAARAEPARAVELYRRAAAGLTALADAGVCNAALEYNLGNVHFRLGDLGRAVLHYRRAQRLDPGSERVAANLRYARERVEPAIPAGGGSRLARQLLFWHYRTSAAARARAVIGLGLLGWALLTAWLRWPRRGLWIGGATVLVLGWAAGASVLYQLHDEAVRPGAVLVGTPQVLRLGRGEGSDPALKQPLGPGVELRITQQRGDWVEVELASGQTGWLPRAAVELVRP